MHDLKVHHAGPAPRYAFTRGEPREIDTPFATGGLPERASIPKAGPPRRSGLPPCRCGKTIALRIAGVWRCTRCGTARQLP